MYNTRVTRNMLTDKPVLKIGYCAAHYLLSDLQRVGYMSGVYGWNCDVYDVEGVYILTGYRFSVSGKYVNHDILEGLEKSAEAAFRASWNNPEGFEAYKATVEAARRELIEKSM